MGYIEHTVIPILQMKRLRLREFKSPECGQRSVCIAYALNCIIDCVLSLITTFMQIVQKIFSTEIFLLNILSSMGEQPCFI